MREKEIEPFAWLSQKTSHRWRRNVYVSATSQTGRGVFANKAFHMGDRVLVFEGPKKQRDEFISADELAHALQIDIDIYLGPSGGEDDFVNHSCDPNTYLKGRQTLVANRSIAPDEEITVDYASVTEELNWQMKCQCGARNCRGLIRSFSETPEHIRQQPHFQTWLAKSLFRN